jgi:5-methyltetrahydrofolate--homocysteine methyltransferase
VIVIAERINATRKRIRRALEERDEGHIRREVEKQARYSATYIDLNAGSDPARETENLCWLVKVALNATELPLAIDTANPEALAAALKLVEGRDVMINSVTGEKESMEQVLPLAAESGASLVALTHDEAGLPTSVGQRIEVTGRIVEAAGAHDIPVSRLFIDPCIQPLSTSPDQAAVCIEAVRRIMDEFPGIHTTCGESNISFGLPYRSIVNRAYLTMLLAAGLDSAVIDPTDRDMIATILATEALVGKDDYCMNYIMAEREGRLRD